MKLAIMSNQTEKSIRFQRVAAVFLVLGCLMQASGAAEKPTNAAISYEENGLENRSPRVFDGVRVLVNPPATGLLLVPDSGNRRIMAFDALSGDLLDENYIPVDPLRLRTPIEILLSADGNSLLVSDQIEDVVRQYDLEGNYLKIFAPSGGPDTGVLDNIRGMALADNGNLLVSVANGPNAHGVAEFDGNGNFLGNRIATHAGGLTSPFDVLNSDGELLVSGSSSSQIHRYDGNGTSLGNLAAIDAFPEQIAATSSGGLLVANFAGTDAGIIELDSAGNPIGRYAPATQSGFRGVYELPNGNLLVTNSNGVHEIDRAGNVVETKISGVSARFITFLPVTPAFTAVPPPQQVPLFHPLALLLLSGLLGGVVLFRRS